MKGNFLAGIFGLFAIFGLAFGAYTTFTDLQTTGDMLVGDDLTVTGDATLSDDCNVGGDLTVTGSIGGSGPLEGTTLSANYFVFLSTYAVSTQTPTVVGQLALDSNYDVYVASGNDNPTQWIKVGDQ